MFKKDYPGIITTAVFSIFVFIAMMKIFDSFDILGFFACIFWGVVCAIITLVVLLKVQSKQEEQAQMEAAREKARQEQATKERAEINCKQNIAITNTAKTEERKNPILIRDILDDYTVIDLETTGLNSQQDEIIEIAAVRVRNKKIVDEYSSLVNPHKRLDYSIVRLTGITDDMLEHERDISQVMPEFLNFVGDDIILGHNIVGFDLGFIKKQTTFTNTCLDTLWAAQSILNSTSGNKLVDLCNKFNIPQNNAHRALSDCISTHYVYQKICDKNESRNYFACELATVGKSYQENIYTTCKIGAELRFYYDSQNNKYMFTCCEKPIGYAKADAHKLFDKNRDSIANIRITDISENEKGRKLVTAEIKLSDVLKI